MSAETDLEEEDVVDTETEQEDRPDPEQEKARILGEAKARTLGWVPKEEWRGAEADWITANEFLQRANPAVLNRLDRLEESYVARNAELEKRLAEQSEVLGEIHGRFKNADRAGYERAKAQYEQQMRDAVSEADTEKFETAKAALDGMGEPPAKPEAKAEPEKPKAEPEGPKHNPVVDQWKAENSWFTDDFVLNRAAEGIHVELQKTHPQFSLRQNLDEVTRQVKEKFPERFANSRRQAPSTVSASTGDRGNGARRGRSFESLPGEAKETFQRLKKQFKTQRGVDYTEAEYLADYGWSDAR